MYCRNCGTLNEDNVLQCVKCGQVLQPISSQFQPRQEVPSHLALAILTTLFCCLPFGVVSIVYAAQVNSKLQAGDYNGAMNCSKKAALWGWLSFGIGLFVGLIYALIVFIGLAAEGFQPVAR